MRKGIAGGSGVEVDLDELRRRVKEAGGIAGIDAWLRGLCGGTGTSAVVSAVAGRPLGDLGTALVGQSYVLGEMAHAIGLKRYLAEAWLDDLWLPAAIAEFDFLPQNL